MKKKLFANLGIKLLSLLIAFGLWIAVVYFTDPQGDETFSNVQVKFENTELLTDQGLVYEVLDNTDIVRRVTVSGPEAVLNEMRAAGNSVIIATADFTDKNMSDVIEIKFDVDPLYASSIKEIKASSNQLKLFVEEKKSKSVSLRINCTGQDELAEDHQLTSYKADMNRITVTGGKSKVDMVAYAAVTVDVTGSDSDISTTETIRLYDENDNQLDTSLIQMNSTSTKVNVTIQATKTVPVEFSVSGEVRDGYRLTGVTESSLETIKVAGSDAVLANLTSIVIPAEELDVTDLTEDLVKEINLKSYLPNGVAIANDVTDWTTRVTVAIEREVEKSFKMRAGNITIANVPEGVTYETAASYEVYDVPVAGLNGEISLIEESALKGTVDVAKWMEEENMEALNPGTYYIPADITLPEGVELTAPVEVRVTFTAKAEETE